MKAWQEEIRELSTVASTQPQVAYAVYTNVLRHKWSFIARTMPGVAPHLEQLESTISESFIPALLDHPQPGDTECQVLALPSRYAGMGIVSPVSLVNQFPSSLPITESLVQRILNQDTPPQEEADNTRAAKAKAKADARKTKQRHAKEVYDGVDAEVHESCG